MADRDSHCLGGVRVGALELKRYMSRGIRIGKWRWKVSPLFSNQFLSALRVELLSSQQVNFRATESLSLSWVSGYFPIAAWRGKGEAAP